MGGGFNSPQNITINIYIYVMMMIGKICWSDLYHYKNVSKPRCYYKVEKKGDLSREVKMRNAEKMYITLPVTESVKITAKHPIFIGGYKDITNNTANSSQGKNKTCDMAQ